MIWAVWGTLALLVLVATVGGGFAGVRALEAWRTVKRFLAIAGYAGDVLAGRVDEAVGKATAAGSGGERVAAATAHLARSFAYARVVADAAGDVRAAAMRLRGAAPRK